MKKAISLMLAFVISFSVFAMLNTSVFAADNGDVKITFDANGGINTGYDTYTVESIQNQGKMPEAIGSTFVSNSSVCNIIGGFAQPYDENKNPDILADIEYEARFGNRKRYKPWKSRTGEDDGSVYRTREINIYVTSEQTTVDLKDGYDVNVEVSFVYSYYYYELESASPTKKRTFIWTETYGLFPGGYHIDSYDEGIACYFKYYPFMESSLGGYNDIEKIDIFVDVSNEDSDLQFKLFLIKQWPMVNNTLAPKDHPLIIADHNYRFDISERHNKNYTYPSDKMGNIYTNVNIYLDGTGIWEGYSYKIGVASGFFIVYNEYITKQITDDGLITFSGWYTQEIGGDLVTFDDIANLESDTTLYTHLPTEDIGINFYDGENYLGTTYAKMDEPITFLQSPSRKAYIFLGWAKNNGELVSDGSTVFDINTNKLYAKWINKYEISFSDEVDEEIYVGETKNIGINYTPELEDEIDCTWTVDNSDILSVDDKGNITGLLCGSTNVTVTAEGGSSVTKNVKVNHFYKYEYVQSPSCEEMGVLLFSCACGDSFKQAVPPLGHTVVVQSEKEATCVEGGFSQRTYCTVCNKVISEIGSTPATKIHIDNNSDNSCDYCGRLISGIINVENSADKVVKGEYETFKIVTTTDVDCLKLKRSYTLSDGTKKSVTTIYKSSSANSNLSVTDNEESLIWVINSKCSYDSLESVVFDYNLSYKIENETMYKSYNEVPYKVSVVCEEEPPKIDVYEPFTLIGVNYSQADNEVVTVTVITTSDCSKVRVGYMSDTGSMKYTTYQTTSKSVSYSDDNGLRTWIINYKTVQPKETVYTVNARGNLWGDLKHLNINFQGTGFLLSLFCSAVR